MTCLLVHGVPDTWRLWDAVRARLEREDVRALALPGFAAAAPAGFDFSMDAYAGWLAAAVEAEAAASGAPVDLVGHDWGGLLVQRVGGLRPELVRSWAAGGVAIDEAYVWHDIAQIWQTPGEGEALMAAMDAPAMAEALRAEGVPPAEAEAMAAAADAPMKAAILALYRSATRIGADWADALPGLPRPGLVLWGEHDPYAAPAVGERLARRTGARFLLFKDCGHWWPYERPEETAQALAALWAEAG